MLPKVTKLWTTKDGFRIRICDLSDAHLLNSIHLLERLAQYHTSEAIPACESFLSTLQGEMAIMQAENELLSLLSHGIDPNDVNPLYDSLIDEAARRSLPLLEETNV